MIKIKTKYIALYFLGILLLIFGQRSFWENLIKEKEDQKEALKLRQEAENAFSQQFEVQKLEYDSVNRKWKNNNLYFQIIHTGSINFKALKNKSKTVVETNDEENASESS
ncbi:MULTISPECIES: hypothetical protein [Flavobacterium]|uniref:hypothetical protein n=1 Tax=Flavobacterium TaxID=237 RepID=UPI001182D4FB|nr:MULTISPECIES: hypothetical protein [Flavobacterium]MCR4031447.1 hypothetical protein [Flavobacterium panacis]